MDWTKSLMLSIGCLFKEMKVSTIVMLTCLSEDQDWILTVFVMVLQGGSKVYSNIKVTSRVSICVETKWRTTIASWKLLMAPFHRNKARIFGQTIWWFLPIHRYVVCKVNWEFQEWFRNNKSSCSAMTRCYSESDSISKGNPVCSCFSHWQFLNHGDGIARPATFGKQFSVSNLNQHGCWRKWSDLYCSGWRHTVWDKTKS